MKRKDILDIVNTAKSQDRKDEISMFGKSINYHNVTRNKKKYTRKAKHKKLY